MLTPFAVIHEGLQRIAYVFLDLFVDSIFDFEPQNIWIGLLEPIRLPADKDPRRTSYLDLCLLLA